MADTQPLGHTLSVSITDTGALTFADEHASSIEFPVLQPWLQL